MALSVIQAFNEFKRTVTLTDTQEKTVSDRQDSAHNYLSAAFPSTSDMPLFRSKLIGSAQRNTMIRPLEDIDILAIFDNKDNIFDAYRYESFAFINRVRDALNEYKVDIVGTRGQAVRLFYKTLPHVDIAPVFRWKSGGFALPDGKGRWLTTDPDAHYEYMRNRNKELNYRLKPLVRMLKRWNKVHSGRFKSFHLEALIAKIFSSIGNDSRDACEKFFEWAQSSISVSDPAGHGGDLSSYLTQPNRILIIANLESAHYRAKRANEAESRGDYEESIRLWRIIFGNEFPQYG